MDYRRIPPVDRKMIRPTAWRVPVSRVCGLRGVGFATHPLQFGVLGIGHICRQGDSIGYVKTPDISSTLVPSRCFCLLGLLYSCTHIPRRMKLLSAIPLCSPLMAGIFIWLLYRHAGGIVLTLNLRILAFDFCGVHTATKTQFSYHNILSQYSITIFLSKARNLKSRNQLTWWRRSAHLCLSWCFVRSI